MPIPQHFTFEGQIGLVDWRTHARITTLDAITAYLVMGRSGHYSNHTGPAVRSLSDEDTQALRIEPNTPVLFQMGGEKGEGKPLYH